jgi:hypothetical protein
MKKNLLVFSASLVACATMQAQDAQVSAGDNSSGAGGEASYSIGIAIYSGFKGDSGWVNQGVQQAYDEVLSSSVDPIESGINFTTYPNPVLNVVHLQNQQVESGNYKYLLCDASGKVIRQENVTSALTEIPLYGLASGIYFLRIQNNDQEVQSFKLMKYE